MNPVLREALAAPHQAGHAERATQVLCHIHSLYTVYALLLIFDRDGRVVAVSKPDAQAWVGRRLDADWVRDTLALPDNQAHTVSRFEPSPLYDNQHTLIYGAAVFPPTSTGVTQPACGGIAIVFDTAPQFAAMLGDCLPAQGEGIGLLVERGGTVQASSDARFPVGSRAPLAAQVAALERGQAQQIVVELDGMFYAAGLCQSSGYREYRNSRTPDERDVAGVMLMPLCPAVTAASQGRRVAPAKPPSATRLSPAERLEIASFVADGQWLGVPAEQVVEALEGQRLTSVPNAPAFLAGLLPRGRHMPIPVVDLAMLRGSTRATSGPGGLIVVCRGERGAQVGLLVDELAPVFETAHHALQPMPMLGGDVGAGEKLLRLPAPPAAASQNGSPNSSLSGGSMLILLALDTVLARLGAQHIVTPEAPPEQTLEPVPQHAPAATVARQASPMAWT
jgi:chemotaxis signal transduction protein